jgi:hypothetical protein
VEVEQEMTTKCLAVMFAITSFGAAQSAPSQKPAVIVCIEPEPEVRMGVLPLASAMFASIGVKLDWHESDSCPVGVRVVHVRFSRGGSGPRDSDALAFAQPYEGSIVVFLDRIHQSNHNGLPVVMAHVLVHEITHVLEAINRHSATGIMKARWNGQDYSEMRRKRLPFAPEDINLIYDGLKASRPSSVATAIRPALAGQ